MELLIRALFDPRRSAAIALLVVLGAGTVAAAQEPLERAVKSVYLFKFGDYVEWPEGTLAEGQPFAIGVLGRDPLGTTLDDAVRGRTVGGRSIVVRRFDRLADVRDIHVLYISPSRAEGSEEILSALDGRRILTVSEKLADAGAIIEFVRQESKVRFEIDAAAAQRAGLKLRSELMSLALAVRKAE